MKEKLQEMDVLFDKIRSNIAKQDEISGKKTMLVLCSDHGMTEMGNHGGASDDESSAVLLFGNLPARSTLISSREQMDLVPLLSAVFGLPTPKMSTGRIIEDVLLAACERQQLMSTEHCYLHQILDNNRQLLSLAKLKLPYGTYHEFQVRHEQILSTFVNRTDTELHALGANAVKWANDIQHDILGVSSNHYNDALIVFGILVVLCCAMYSTTKLSKDQYSWTDVYFASASFMYAISLGSSSFIENEHAVCFYMATSCICWLACQSTTKPRVFGRLLCIMILLRILRSRNQIINFSRLNHLPSNNDATISVLPSTSMHVSLVFLHLGCVWLIGIYISPKTLWPSHTLAMCCITLHHYLEHFEMDHYHTIHINTIARFMVMASITPFLYARHATNIIQLASWHIILLLQR